jgi:hypothetical protein
MATEVIIESIDFLSHDHFIAYFTDGTYVMITAKELKERFADRLVRGPEFEED